MQGRPQLFPDGHQISVLVSAEDYQALAGLVQKNRIGRPGFSFGDLLRSYIRRCLAEEPRRRRLVSEDPESNRVRRLHAIARSAHQLAKELESKV